MPCTEEKRKCPRFKIQQNAEPNSCFFLTSIINWAWVLQICQPFWVAFGPTVCKLLKKQKLQAPKKKKTPYFSDLAKWHLPEYCGCCPFTSNKTYPVSAAELEVLQPGTQNQAIKPSTAKKREVHKKCLSSCLSSWKEDGATVRPILELFQRQHWKNICEHFLHW